MDEKLHPLFSRYVITYPYPCSYFTEELKPRVIKPSEDYSDKPHIAAWWK